MGLARKPHTVKIVAGLLSNDQEALLRAEARLKRIFGPTDYESGCFEFTHTDYYTAEMGPGLRRKFLAFRKRVPLNGISAVKRATNRIEQSLARGGRRTVNIDPGYLDLAKLVLFSTKDYAHRIYLDRGIFAEVTLHYRDGSFRPWPWTYPDYASDAYIRIFNAMRDLYKKRER